jgi:hypothetical protein
MLFMLVGGFIMVWVLFMGWKFYQTIDWEEKAEPSPDLRGMHKKEAELMHIQELLADACDEGKLSQGVVDEFTRYCDAEIEAMHKVETTWKSRRKAT